MLPLTLLAGAQAAGLALAGLVAGTFLGAAVQSWLRVDIIPLGVSAPCLHSLGDLGGLVSFCGAWSL